MAPTATRSLAANTAVGTVAAGHQRRRGVGPGLLTEVAGKHLDEAPQTRRRHGLAVGAAARAGAGAAPAVDVDDPLVAEPAQVLDDEVRCPSSSVITLSTPSARTRRPTTTIGTCAATVAIEPAGRRGLTRMIPSGRYSRNPRIAVELGLSAVAAGSEQQAVPLRIRSLDEAVERLGEERVVQVIEEHGDHSGLPAGQAPRHRVRRVPQLLGRRPHPLATLGADVRAVADDERDERP